MVYCETLEFTRLPVCVQMSMSNIFKKNYVRNQAHFGTTNLSDPMNNKCNFGNHICGVRAEQELGILIQ